MLASEATVTVMLNVECSIEHQELRIEHTLETRDPPFDGLRASRACRGTLQEERAFGRCCDEPS